MAAHSVVTNIVQPRLTKDIYMCFHWLRCRAAQRKFRYYWIPGPNNLANYTTNHHAGLHHRNVRHGYLASLAHLEAYRMLQKQGLNYIQVSQLQSSMATPRLLAQTKDRLRDTKSCSKGVLDLGVGNNTNMGRETQIPSQ